MAGSYRAFISYSHSDAAAARWLHARLETYRLPDGIGQVSAAAKPNGQLGPIFRDREELPASEDLSASVRAALAASDVLVVLCSPAARASRWVSREIELFREIGPDRPILAAIVAGEPGEAFPEPLLQGREPLAADLRKQGDGRRLGFLKIVAGIAGVPLDTLVQRDAQRNLRRVTAVTLGTAAIALAMSIMTVIAIQSRNEADSQRGEAVTMAQYMSTDLRDKLRGVGRLDLMADVVERALAYCESQGELSALPSDGLEGCAQSLHARVEIETNRDKPDLDAAAADADQARRMTAALLEADPRNPDFVFAHGQSEYWVGHVYERREDYAAAGHWYARYRRSAATLGAMEPNSVRSIMERGYGELNQGIVGFTARGSSREAAELFERSIQWFTRAQELEPDNEFFRGQLANAYAWLADVHYKAGDYPAALRAQTQAEWRKRALAEADPRDLDKYFNLLVSERALALTRYHLGHRAEAKAGLARLAVLTAQLSARDPEKWEWGHIAEKTKTDVARLD